jgi:hypothetical protein
VLLIDLAFYFGYWLINGHAPGWPIWLAYLLGSFVAHVAAEFKKR